MRAVRGFPECNAHHAADIACVVRERVAASSPRTDSNPTSAVCDAERQRTRGRKKRVTAKGARSKKCVQAANDVLSGILRGARKEDGMIIKNAEFLTSVADPGKLPDLGVPEIAFAGKSNVGKSSFINFLTGNGKLARTSGDPGRTRLVNYFGVNGKSLVFVDLPGYGFAKVAKSEKAKWGSMIEGYLTGSKNLVNVFVLLDVRHEPTSDDKMLLNFLYHYNIPFTVIATKCDKLSRAQLTKRRAEIANAIGVGVGNVFLISSLKKTGKEDILARIDTLTEAWNAANAGDGGED